MLKIKNIQTIIGQEYNEVFNIIGVKEHKDHYEFTLGYDATIKPAVHRKQTDNGMYIMEYNNKTLWLNTNEFDTTDKIIICMQTI
jgi:hypothetical protein